MSTDSMSNVGTSFFFFVHFPRIDSSGNSRVFFNIILKFQKLFENYCEILKNEIQPTHSSARDL